jgi:hypothetical protein
MEIRMNNTGKWLGQAKFYTFSLIALLLLSSCNRGSVVPVDPLVMTPEEVVESFYNWLLEYPGNPRSDGAFRNSPFLSTEFIQEIDDFTRAPALGGADPFFCAQDIPDKIYVYPAEIEGGSALVSMETSFTNHRLQIELNLVDSEWKILHVHCGR